MVLRYERETSAAKTLTGSGYYVRFPEGVYEVALEDADTEKAVADAYDAVEYVGGDEDVDHSDEDNSSESDDRRPQDDDEDDDTLEDMGEELAAAEYVSGLDDDEPEE